MRSGAALPSPEQIEDLYALASSGGPLAELAEVATMFADLYDLALDRTDLVAVTAKEAGELVGFGYALAAGFRRGLPGSAALPQDGLPPPWPWS